MTIEETVFKMTECANELYSSKKHSHILAAKELLQLIDSICDTNSISMPDEGVVLNIELDEFFGEPVL